MAPTQLVGVTFRDLVRRVEAIGRERWARHATLLSLIANCNRDPKRRRRPFEPRHFNPYRLRERRNGMRVTSANITILRDLFVEKGQGCPPNSD